jgi:hypothetical protein
VVLWCPREKNLPSIRLGENRSAVEAAAVAVAVVAALQPQQVQRESLVEEG